VIVLYCVNLSEKINLLCICCFISVCHEVFFTMFRTFGKLSSAADLYDKCLSLCESLADDLHEQRLLVSNSADVLLTELCGMLEC